MARKPLKISKSQYIKGIRCPKALWLYRRRPDLYPDVSEYQKYVFDTGHEVGALAQEYFQGGIEITEDYTEIEAAIESTQKAIKKGHKIIFEATACSWDNAYSRIDILKKVRGSNAWDMIEVKSATGIMDYHIDDAAFQRYAFEGAGYTIRKSILMYLNREYIRKGDLDLKGMFVLQDITKEVKERLDGIPGDLAELFGLLRKRKEPAVDIGNQCYAPFACDYIEYCWRDMPGYSVHDIFKGGKLEELLSLGIVNPADVPDDFEMTERQAIEVSSVKDNEIHTDKGAIRKFLDALKYPLYCLDYETIYPAVPMFDNSSPYQQIPFQFSLHVLNKKGGSIKHIEFLHTENSDPRPHFIEALLKACKKRGSILVYNASFEARVNSSLGRLFPKYKDKLQALNDRMVDLLVPFRSRFLYHPEMCGSASLKDVLPAFVPDMSYDNLEINNGGMASLNYLQFLSGDLSVTEQECVFRDLRQYCGQDTLAEVKLLSAFENHSKHAEDR